MKKILYYVTDHGKGHATRSIAIIQEILKHNIEVVVRNTNAIKFFKQSLPDVKTILGKTDVGSAIKKDGERGLISYLSNLKIEDISADLGLEPVSLSA